MCVSYIENYCKLDKDMLAKINNFLVDLLSNDEISKDIDNLKFDSSYAYIADNIYSKGFSSNTKGIPTVELITSMLMKEVINEVGEQTFFDEYPYSDETPTLFNGLVIEQDLILRRLDPSGNNLLLGLGFNGSVMVTCDIDDFALASTKFQSLILTGNCTAVRNCGLRYVWVTKLLHIGKSVTSIDEESWESIITTKELVYDLSKEEFAEVLDLSESELDKFTNIRYLKK